jgi:hypothetical protein
MVRYSHVSLLVLCDAADAGVITAHLGVAPSCVRKSTSQSVQAGGTVAEDAHHTWVLDSPLSAEAGDPTDRLWALAEVIQPFGDRLLALDARFPRWVDILYHATPQHPHGVTGEFDWFRMPAELMKFFASWGLDVSYEVFWFDHPDWQPPGRSVWAPLRRWFGGLGKRRDGGTQVAS